MDERRKLLMPVKAIRTLLIQTDSCADHFESVSGDILTELVTLANHQDTRIETLE